MNDHPPDRYDATLFYARTQGRSEAPIGAPPGLPLRRKVKILAWTIARRASVLMRQTTSIFLKALSALALGLFLAGCAPAEPPYPNVVPIDTTGNYGA